SDGGVAVVRDRGHGRAGHREHQRCARARSGGDRQPERVHRHPGRNRRPRVPENRYQGAGVERTHLPTAPTYRTYLPHPAPIAPTAPTYRTSPPHLPTAPTAPNGPTNRTHRPNRTYRTALMPPPLAAAVWTRRCRADGRTARASSAGAGHVP